MRRSPRAFGLDGLVPMSFKRCDGHEEMNKSASRTTYGEQRAIGLVHAL